MVRTVTALGIGLVLLGAVLVAGPTFGFSTIAGDRGVSVGTAEDPDALLGIDSEGNVGELRGDDDPVVVGTLSNNADEPLDAQDVVIDSITDGEGTELSTDILRVVDPDDGDPIESTGTDVTVECAQGENINGDQEVVIRIGEAGGSTVSIIDSTFSVVIDIQCNKGGGGGGGSSGENIWFDFETDTTIEQIGVDSEIDDADLIFRGEEPEFEVFDEEENLIGNFNTNANNANQAYEANGDLEDVNAEITSSKEVSVRIGEFGTNSGGNTFDGYEFEGLQRISDENAAEITITLSFGQGENVEIYFEETN